LQYRRREKGPRCNLSKNSSPLIKGPYKEKRIKKDPLRQPFRPTVTKVISNKAEGRKALGMSLQNKPFLPQKGKVKEAGKGGGEALGESEKRGRRPNATLTETRRIFKNGNLGFNRGPEVKPEKKEQETFVDERTQSLQGLGTLPAWWGKRMTARKK